MRRVSPAGPVVSLVLAAGARLLYFPDENHWVLDPANSVQRHEEVLGWLTRWLEP